MHGGAAATKGGSISGFIDPAAGPSYALFRRGVSGAALSIDAGDGGGGGRCWGGGVCDAPQCSEPACRTMSGKLFYS